MISVRIITGYAEGFLLTLGFYSNSYSLGNRAYCEACSICGLICCVGKIPMQVQRITADPNIVADRGKVALKYGPLIYNVEEADNKDITKAIGTGPLTTEWQANLLSGIITIKGTWADGTPLVAIPNYARNNRKAAADAKETHNSAVWIRKE